MVDLIFLYFYRESQRTESSGDDAGYESLHNNHPSSQSSLIRNIQNSNLQHEPRYASLGIDSRKNLFFSINNMYLG